jgi:hypothetical protein
MKEAGEMSRFSTAKFTGEEYEFAYKLINANKLQQIPTKLEK